jgi:K+-sensing histidine kinase KdpD
MALPAMCSATMAFFLMPPLFSLRVSQTHDIVAIVLYVTAGLVLAKTASSYKKGGGGRVDPVCEFPSRKLGL